DARDDDERGSRPRGRGGVRRGDGPDGAVAQHRRAARRRAEVPRRRRAARHDEGTRRQPSAGDRANDRGGRGERRQRDPRDALRYLRDGPDLDRDLRVRDRRASRSRISRPAAGVAAGHGRGWLSGTRMRAPPSAARTARRRYSRRGSRPPRLPPSGSMPQTEAIASGAEHGKAGEARLLGLPAGIRACLFDLDGVLTQTARVHAAAWKQMFDAFLRERAERTGERFVPFDPLVDYDEYVDGKPRYDGVRSFLASRGIELPEG